MKPRSKRDTKAIDRALARIDMRKKIERAEAAARAQALIQARQRERREKAAKPVKGARPIARVGVAGWRVLLTRMQPGVWYSFSELRALMPEFASGSMKAWVMQKLYPSGALARAGHPDFDASDPLSATRHGRFVYALSVEGERMALEIDTGDRTDAIQGPDDN